jgi:hypothetical protein
VIAAADVELGVLVKYRLGLSVDGTARGEQGGMPIVIVWTPRKAISCLVEINSAGRKDQLVNE